MLKSDILTLWHCKIPWLVSSYPYSTKHPREKYVIQHYPRTLGENPNLSNPKSSTLIINYFDSFFPWVWSAYDKEDIYIAIEKKKFSFGVDQ